MAAGNEGRLGDLPQSWRKYGRGEPRPGADAAGVSPVPAQMWLAPRRLCDPALRRVRRKDHDVRMHDVAVDDARACHT